MYDYICDKCNFTDEYSTNKSVPKDMQPPEKCPKCQEGTMIRQFSPSGQSFDVIGGYDYTYGKKAWKKNMNMEDQSKVMAGTKAPY
jgi:ssDNA-binding Zn-finger/Zn-ribbon topoisomerase 1